MQFFVRASPRDCLIDFAHADLSRKLPLDATISFYSSSKQEYAACVAVQTVAEHEVLGWESLAEDFDYGVSEVSGRRVHWQAGRLVDYQYVIVFEQHRYVVWDFVFVPRWAPNGDVLLRSEASTGFDRGTVDVSGGSLSDEFCSRAARVLECCREEDIDTCAGVLLGHPKNGKHSVAIDVVRSDDIRVFVGWDPSQRLQSPG